MTNDPPGTNQVDPPSQDAPGTNQVNLPSQDAPGTNQVNPPSQDVPETGQVDPPSQVPSFETLKDSLANQVPSDIQLTVPESPSPKTTGEIINTYNDNMAKVLDDARTAAIWSFVNNEKERTDRQKPLLYIVVGLAALQLTVFNVIIGGIVWLSFKCGLENVLTLLFDILKYYIGATAAELIAMIWFITKGTFSSHHVKMLKLLLGQNSQQSNKDKDQQT